MGVVAGEGGPQPGEHAEKIQIPQSSNKKNKLVRTIIEYGLILFKG